jgi:hypothetical protein
VQLRPFSHHLDLTTYTNSNTIFDLPSHPAHTSHPSTNAPHATPHRTTRSTPHPNPTYFPIHSHSTPSRTTPHTGLLPHIFKGPQFQRPVHWPQTSNCRSEELEDTRVTPKNPFQRRKRGIYTLYFSDYDDVLIQIFCLLLFQQLFLVLNFFFIFCRAESRGND